MNHCGIRRWTALCGTCGWSETILTSETTNRGLAREIAEVKHKNEMPACELAGVTVAERWGR
jgi:hypothetical protein